MSSLEGHLFDSEGKEVVVPEGVDIVIGGDSMVLVETPQYSAKFVFKSPMENHDKMEICKRLLQDWSNEKDQGQ